MGGEVKMEKIRQSLNDFVRPQNEGAEFAQNNYIGKRNEIKEAPGDLGLHGDSISIGRNG